MSKLVIANFKSHKSLSQVNTWFNACVPTLTTTKHSIIIAPSYIFLSSLHEMLRSKHWSHVSLGVQDISSMSAGAYTGAVSTLNLEGLDVSHAIVGHSERRQYFKETSIDVANKVELCLEANITPIVCITSTTLDEQAAALKPEHRTKVIIAFEPTDHIGTGEADDLEHVLLISTRVKTVFGSVPFIYGGSVDAHTDPNLLHHNDIHGFLVGTASLKVSDFSSLLAAL